MADDLDVDDLLEAPYQKVKTEESEVNIAVIFVTCVKISHVNMVQLFQPQLINVIFDRMTC